MEAFTELFLHKVFLHDALAPYKMSFLTRDVFLPLDDPTFNDILNHDNYDPGEDPFHCLVNDTDFLLAEDRVISSLAASDTEYKKVIPCCSNCLSNLDHESLSPGLISTPAVSPILLQLALFGFNLVLVVFVIFSFWHFTEWFRYSHAGTYQHRSEPWMEISRCYSTSFQDGFADNSD